MIDYALFSMYRGKTHVAVGVQPERDCLVLVHVCGDDPTTDLYEGCFSEAVGREILAAAEQENYRRVSTIFRKSFQSKKAWKHVRDTASFGKLSDHVSDAWFDGFANVLFDLEETKERGTLKYEVCL